MRNNDIFFLIYFQRKIVEFFRIFFEKNSKSADSWKYFGVIGGASANLVLRNEIQKICDYYGVTLLLAPLEYCSDNAAMIGRVALESYLRGEWSDFNLQVKPRVSSLSI